MKKKLKNLSKRLIRILYIKHSLLQEIEADTFLTNHQIYAETN